MNLTYLADVNFLHMFGILIFSFVLNLLFATFTCLVVALKPLKAATTGMAITFLNTAGVVACISDYRYFIPLLIGSWTGNFVIVYLKKRSINKIKK